MKFENHQWLPVFHELYGNSQDVIQYQTDRYKRLIDSFHSKFEETDIHFFSTPGRTEIGGNHTDHNHGIVLAGSVNLDSIAAAGKTDNGYITIISDAFPDPFRINIQELDIQSDEEGTTTSLIRGIAARFKQLDFQIGGFNAYITSDVLVGSGLSSSASIEVLIATIMNSFFNDGKILKETLAVIGQFAENHYFNKPCGLMDQMTCSMGGIISIDFKNPENATVKKVDFDFQNQDYSLVVVNTQGNHADLTDLYAAIPHEMISVAENLGHDFGRDIDIAELISQINPLRKKVGDRALLRMLHFLNENKRVLKQVTALENDDFQNFLHMISESGRSSNMWLQNCNSNLNSREQGLNLALAVTDNFLKEKGEGACRVHGGGFAGTIQVFIPNRFLDEYKALINPIYGDDSVYVLSIRSLGTCCLNQTFSLN